MNAPVKKIYALLPRPVKQMVLRQYEDYWRAWAFKQTRQTAVSFSSRLKNSKPRILFYFVSGLSYGGCSKMMQIFAKHLDFVRYEVFFMYSAKPRDINGNNQADDTRKFYLENSPVHLIEHTYGSIDPVYPFVIRDMCPSFLEVIKRENIDLLVTTSSGYAEFPFNLVTDLPILNFNIFGSPAVQHNIVKNLCISREVADQIAPVVDRQKIEIFYIPSEPPPAGSLDDGRDLRRRLGLADSDLVFGRIGRGVDSIFDPIGIKAFQIVVKKYPQAHYLIMSPPPVLEKIVGHEDIPNVHFLPPSGQEKDIWAFHQAVDVLGHFRKDGESFGLNIAESMLCGKPILSHKSHFWNAHLEYLDDSFSRVAGVDNVAQYAEYMEYFINLPAADRKQMGQLAKQKAEKLFLIQNNIGRFEQILTEVLNN